MIANTTAMATETQLCDENLTWVYQVEGRMLVPQTQKEHNGNVVHHMRFFKENGDTDSEYYKFRATRTLMRDVDGNFFDICVSASSRPSKEWLFKEEGSKVWVYDNDRKKDILMYDFLAKTGDILPGCQHGQVFAEIQDWKYAVMSLPDTLLDGSLRHRYTATVTADNADTRIANTELQCIEGIGATCGFLPNMYVMAVTHGPFESVSVDTPGMLGYLVAVYDNSGNFLYGDKASYDALVNRLSGIGDIIADDNAAPVYFNLQGQRITAPVKGQPCIERHGGKARKIMPK